MALFGFAPGCFFAPALFRKTPASFLNAVMVPFLLLTIGWLLYIIFIALMRSLDMEIASLFGAIFGMLPFCSNNLTVFVIQSALVLAIYKW